MSPAERWQHYDRLEAQLSTFTFVDPDVCPPGDCDEGEVYGALSVQPVFPGSRVLFGVVALSHEPGASNEALLVALHELGHIAMHHKRKGRFVVGPRIPALRREAEAWQWALNNLPPGLELSPDDYCAVHWRLKSYGDYRRFKRHPLFDSLLAEVGRKCIA